MLGYQIKDGDQYNAQLGLAAEEVLRGLRRMAALAQWTFDHQDIVDGFPLVPDEPSTVEAVRAEFATLGALAESSATFHTRRLVAANPLA